MKCLQHKVHTLGESSLCLKICCFFLSSMDGVDRKTVTQNDLD